MLPPPMNAITGSGALVIHAVLLIGNAEDSPHAAGSATMAARAARMGVDAAHRARAGGAPAIPPRHSRDGRAPNSALPMRTMLAPSPSASR